MSQNIGNELSFLLFDVLKAQSLSERDRYSEFSIETIEAVLDMSKKLAQTHYAPHYQKGDRHEPQFIDGSAHVLDEVKSAWKATAECGIMAAHHDAELGGMQMPQLVQAACMTHLFAANVACAAYPFLTIGAANLIRSFASDDLRDLFLSPMLDGRFSGTMALTEPSQGSALADITTSAHLADDGTYRLKGHKMYISGGDQDITQNIIHLVLAKIDGAPLGVKGISLFICPKFLVNADQSLGARNDVACAGLLHKMGYRQTTSTVLNFGEADTCVAYLVGEAHRGLDYMFQMMNEARINVSLGAASLGLMGYYASLDYARNRPQGRLPSNKDAASKQVAIVEHADVKRMLLAQKSYCEGALCLSLYAAKLVDDHKTLDDPELALNAGQLLDFLTPIVKTFASEYGVRANDLAIQVHGGAGYIREYPVEQYYRDNRLNPIHEGTTGIQGLDLLGRKLRQNKGSSFNAYVSAIEESLSEAANFEALSDKSQALMTALDRFKNISESLMALMAMDSDRAVANATLYLDFAGRVTIAWIWLQQAMTAQKILQDSELTTPRHNYLMGKLQAASYYYDYELPQIEPMAKLLIDANRTCLDMQEAWF